MFAEVLVPVFFSLNLLLENKLILGEITHKDYVAMPPIFHLDDYDRCMLHGEEALYCMVEVHLYPTNPKNTSRIWNIIEEISSDPNKFRHDLLRRGVCIPEAYPRYSNEKNLDLSTVLNGLYRQQFKAKEIEAEVTVLRCETNESSYPIDSYDLGFAVIAAIYCSIIILATSYEAFIKLSNKNLYDEFIITPVGRVCLCVSLRKNWSRLIDLNLSNQDMEALRCLQGIRFFSTVWVVVIHSVFIKIASCSSNPQYIENKITDHDPMMIFGDPTYAMQIFFMITAWLLSYSFFVNMEAQKKITVGHLFRCFIKRYFRLTPTLSILIAFLGTWAVQISRGPTWDYFLGDEYRRCKKNWWSSLLYINNFINEKQMCFIPGWYLTVNMQLYILSLLLLSLMWRYQRQIFLILTTVLVTHIIFLFHIIYSNSYKFSLRLSPEYIYRSRILEYEQFHFSYTSIYFNSSGFIAGLTYGYVFYKYKNQRLFTKKIHVLVWWFIIWTLGLSTFLLPIIVKIDPSVNPFLNAAFGSLWRSVFIFSTGMMLYGMTKGQGWPIKTVFEARPIYILGRLTYSAFLIHTVIQRVKGGIGRSLNYLDELIFFFGSVEDVALTFVGALFCTMFIEMPLSELGKLFMMANDDKKKWKLS